MNDQYTLGAGFPISETTLSKQTKNRLLEAGVRDVDALMKIGIAELSARTRGFGRKTVIEIHDFKRGVR